MKNTVKTQQHSAGSQPVTSETCVGGGRTSPPAWHRVCDVGHDFLVIKKAHRSTFPIGLCSQLLPG